MTRFKFSLAFISAAFICAAPLRSQTVVATIPTGTPPSSLVANPVTGMVYVGNQSGSNFVTAINGATGASFTIPVTATPNRLSLNSATNKIYAAMGTGGMVAVIDGATNSVTNVTVGNSPSTPGINPVTNRIYVPNSGSGTVSVIDGATNGVIATITVGTQPVMAAVNPLTNKIYVVNNHPSASTVSVINGATNAVITTLPAGSYCQNIALNPVTNRVYALNNGNGPGSVTVIDGSNDTVMTTVAAGSYNTSIAVNPVTNKIYSIGENSNNMTVIDGATNTPTTVGVGSLPVGVAVNPVTNTIAVTNSGSNTVSLINGATLAVTTVNVGSGAFYAAFNPVTGRLFVINNTGNSVSIIDGANYATGSFTVGGNPNAMAANPVTKKIYVSIPASNVVNVIEVDGTTRSITVGTTPRGIDVNPITNRIYVANYGNNTVSVIDGVSASVIATVPTGIGPNVLNVNSVTNKIYVINVTTNSVTIIDGVNNTASPAIAVGSSPYSADINPVTNKIYVANNQGNSVTEIDGATGTVSATISVGSEPRDVKVNPVTNKIYTPSWRGQVLTIIDGATRTTTTAPTGDGAHFVAVNPLTNKIYVTNYYSNTVTAVDGATNASTTITAGTAPQQIRINLATNKIYTPNLSSANTTVIDGATGIPTMVSTPGSALSALAINPITGQTFVVNNAGSGSTVISEQPVQTIPLITTITPLPGNQTGNPAPVFTFNAASTYAPNAPPPQNVYFRVDGWQGVWLKAAKSGSSWTGTTPTLQPGVHILYAYATDSQETTDNPGEGASPIPGQMAAYLFNELSFAVTTASLPDGVTGIAYAPPALTAAGGSGTGYSWGPVSGFPAWLSLSAAGVLSGTPPATGVVNITVRVTDSAANTTTRSYSFTIRPPFNITTSSLPDGEANVPYAGATFQATGGSTPYTWSPVSALPFGLVLSTAGVLSGTPTTSGSVNITIQATDNVGATNSRAFSFNIFPRIAITTVSLPNGVVGSSYSRTFTTSGGSGGNGWMLSSGITPSGLTFSPGGTLSGTPQVAGRFGFTVQVTDSLGVIDSKPYSLNIVQPLAIINGNLTQGVIGQLYPYTALQPAGGFPQYTFTAPAGTLPPGLSLTSGGQINGQPTQLGDFPVTFTVRDSTNATATRTYTMKVVDDVDQPQWNPRGQFGGKIQEIKISPNYASDQTLFVMSETGELFRSGDRGITWGRSLVNNARAYNYTNRFLLSPVFTGSATATTPEQKTIFFASYDLGVWKSVDQAATFAPANGGIPCGTVPCTGGAYPRIIGLAISPAYASDHTVWVADINNQFFRTLDGGANWTKLTASGIPAATNVLDIQLAPSPAVVSDTTLFASIGNKVYRTLDGGASFVEVASIKNSFNQPLPVQRLVFSPYYAVDHTLLVEADGFLLFRTQDSGNYFADISTPASSYGQHLSVIPRSGNPAIWYMESPNASASVYRLLYSVDNGTTFTPLYAGGMSSGNDFSYALAASPDLAGAGSDLYYGTEQGLYASLDGGFSFNEKDQGLSANVVNGVAGADLAGGTSVLAAAYKGGWFKSVDTGASRVRFAAPNSASSFREVYFNAVSPNYGNDHLIFLGDDSGLLRSVDGGQSYDPILSEPASPNTRYAFAPGFNEVTGTMYLGTATGLQKSTDGGRNFYPAPMPATIPMPCRSSANPAVQGIAVSPNFATDRTLFVSSAAGGDGAGGQAGGLCKSVDRGANWTPVKNGTTLLPGPVAISPTYDEAAASGPNKTLMIYLLRSINGGATWTSATGPAGMRGIPVFSPNFAADQIVFLYGDGIYRSTDGGATFSALGAGDQLRSRTVTGLYLAPGFTAATGEVVASTNGSGVWKSTDGGLTFQASTKSASLPADVSSIVRVPGGSGLTFIGPRQPNAAAVSPGTLFAATTNQGVFKSDDGGVTFASLSKGLPANANTRAVAIPVAGAIPLTAVAGKGLWRYNGTQWVTQSGPNISPTGNYAAFLEDGVYLYATRTDGVSVRSNDGGASWSALQANEADLVKMDYNAQTTPTFLSDPAAKSQGPLLPGGTAAVTANLWAVSKATGPRYSADSGLNWTVTPGGNDYTLPAASGWSVVKALGINPVSQSREIIVGNNNLLPSSDAAKGLFLSRDGGATWRNVSGTGSGLENTSKNFSAAISTVTNAGNTDLLVGANGATNGGVYLSGDGGEHWTQVNAGFDPNNLSISSLIKTSCAGCPVQYYSGSYGGGMYTRTISVVAPPTFPAANYSCYGATPCTCATGGGTGPEQGGQPFQLCGSNFQPNAIVEFDGVPATGCTASATTVTCAGTPPHVPGFAKIRVRNPDTRIGYLPAQYTYTTGASRASLLRVAKAGANAALTWSCAGCTTSPALVYRAQNVSFSAYLEQYNGGTGGAFTNTGAVSSAQSYFWIVE